MTGQQILESALDVLGLRTVNGTIPSDAADLSQRALNLINVLLAENEPLAARIEKRDIEVKSISSLNSDVGMPDLIEAQVLPYGLARLFCIGEDDSSAALFGKLYELARENALRSGRASASPITEVYV